MNIIKLVPEVVSAINSLKEILVTSKYTAEKIEEITQKIDYNEKVTKEALEKIEHNEKVTKEALEKIEQLTALQYHGKNNDSVILEKIHDQKEKIDLFINNNNQRNNLLTFSIEEAWKSSAELFNEHLIDKKIFNSDIELIEYAVELAQNEENFLEFGVFQGRTLKVIANKIGPNKNAFGFDSFEGLPETWRVGFEKSAFAVNTLPDVPSNVTLYKGWFNESLPLFVKNNKANIGFIHIDCDLYSSTICIFEILRERLKNETIIIFDEFFNYPGWQNHEYKALNEFVKKYNYTFKYLGCVPSSQQVLVMLTKTVVQ
jgi:hypothetical protein